MSSSSQRISWRAILRKLRKAQELPAARCSGGLAELRASASIVHQIRDAVGDSDFQGLMNRIVTRSYGFSGREGYLLLACISKFGKSLPDKFLSRIAGQVFEEIDDLSNMELCHFILLLGQRSRRSTILSSEELKDSLLQRTSGLTCKELHYLGLGLAKAEVAAVDLLNAMSSAIDVHIQDFSITQLPNVMVCSTQLGMVDTKLLNRLLIQLEGMVSCMMPPQVSTTLLALAMQAPSEAVSNILEGLETRCFVVAHWSSVGDAVKMLQGLCALSCFNADIFLKLLRRICRVPRSTLSESDDNGLHQVALSLIHDPQAEATLHAVKTSSGLWDDCYQPADVAGELDLSGISQDDSDKDAVLEIFDGRAISLGWQVERETTIADFYHASRILTLDRRQLLLDWDGSSSSTSPTPSNMWTILKHKHARLLGYQIVWARPKQLLQFSEGGCSDPTASAERLWGHALAAAHASE